MDKAEFDKLDIANQVEYINSMLSSKSITKISSEIGIAKSTVLGRMKANGYVKDLEQNKYILKDKENSIIVEKKYNEKKHNNNITKKHYKEVEDLVAVKETLFEMINWYKNHKGDIPESSKFEINLDKLNGEIANKTFMVHTNVLDLYVKFCDKHKEYKKQDIFSQALLEFVERYK